MTTGEGFSKAFLKKFARGMHSATQQQKLPSHVLSPLRIQSEVLAAIPDRPLAIAVCLPK